MKKKIIIIVAAVLCVGLACAILLSASYSVQTFIPELNKEVLAIQVNESSLLGGTILYYSENATMITRFCEELSSDKVTFAGRQSPPFVAYTGRLFEVVLRTSETEYVTFYLTDRGQLYRDRFSYNFSDLNDPDSLISLIEGLDVVATTE